MNDPRNSNHVIAPILFLENGDKLILPTHWEVCPVCDGRGTHVNPSIDSGGISGETFANDPDFADSYFSGVYNVPCHHCGGRTTSQEVDWDAMSEEHQDAYQAQLDEDYLINQEY